MEECGEYSSIVGKYEQELVELSRIWQDHMGKKLPAKAAEYKSCVAALAANENKIVSAATMLKTSVNIAQIDEYISNVNVALTKEYLP